jgi:hypothetical protein
MVMKTVGAKAPATAADALGASNAPAPRPKAKHGAEKRGAREAFVEDSLENSTKNQKRKMAAANSTSRGAVALTLTESNSQASMQHLRKIDGRFGPVLDQFGPPTSLLEPPAIKSAFAALVSGFWRVAPQPS